MSVVEKIRILLVKRGNISEAELARRLNDSPQNFNAKMKWDNFTDKEDAIRKFAELIICTHIVDDVITSGSHYIVWRDLIHQVHPEMQVRGIYLARTVNSESA